MYTCTMPNYISRHVCLLKGARMYVKDVFGQDFRKRDRATHAQGQ